MDDRIVRGGVAEPAALDEDAPLADRVNMVYKGTTAIAGTGFLAYLIYLRRSLQYLDPAAVIPERVKAMLDTLAEGVLVLDQQERIVLANRAFTAAVGQPAADLTGVPASRFGWTRPQACSKTPPQGRQMGRSVFTW